MYQCPELSTYSCVLKCLLSHFPSYCCCKYFQGKECLERAVFLSSSNCRRPDCPAGGQDCLARALQEAKPTSGENHKHNIFSGVGPSWWMSYFLLLLAHLWLWVISGGRKNPMYSNNHQHLSLRDRISRVDLATAENDRCGIRPGLQLRSANGSRTSH